MSTTHTTTVHPTTAVLATLEPGDLVDATLRDGTEIFGFVTETNTLGFSTRDADVHHSDIVTITTDADVAEFTDVHIVQIVDPCGVVKSEGVTDTDGLLLTIVTLLTDNAHTHNAAMDVAGRMLNRQRMLAPRQSRSALCDTDTVRVLTEAVAR